MRTSGALKSLAGYAFNNCGGLVEAEINGTNLDLYNSTRLFENCANLRRVRFGDGVQRLPKATPNYDSGGDSPFKGCTNLCEVFVGRGVTEVPSKFLRSAGCADGLSVSFAAPLTVVGDSAFANGSITNLAICLSSCRLEGSAFKGCPAVNTNNIDFSQVVSIGGSSFEGCGNICGDIDISNSSSLGSYAFAWCGGVTSVNIGSKITSVEARAFYGSSNISLFRFSGAPPSVGSYAFSNVKSGAVGTYTAAHAAEWEAVIDSKGYWNGLKMKPSYYTVIYDANNGTGARTTATVEWGEPTPAGDGTFTWEAHYFMGWAFEDVGGSTLGSDDVIPEPQEGNTVTLYGQWATFEPVAADWGAGSITLKATGVNLKEGEEFFLSYCDASAAESDGAQWDYVEDLNKTTDGTGVSFTDTQFYSRLGGIPAVRYRLQVGKSKGDVRAIPLYCTTRTRYAIAIGLSSWGFAKLDDTGGADNAMTFAGVVNRLGGVKSNNVKTFINAEANTNSVRTAFAETANEVVPGDICIFFINTHGGMHDDDDGKYAVLCMYDGYYEDEELAQDIASLGSDTAVIGIVSACHSGGLFDNSSLSSDSISWHLSNGLAYCPVNVAWITSADAATSSYGIFSKFLLNYGWSNGLAGESGFSFLDLANYTKRRYDALFSGVVFEGEGSSKKAQIWNDPLLGRVVASISGVGLNEETPPSVPNNFTAGRGVSRANIPVSWDAVEGADEYWVFFKFADMDEWLGSWPTSQTSIPFAIRRDDKQLGKYYDSVMSTSKEYPMVFCMKSISWINGVSETSHDTNGWIDSSWDVIFDAGQGYVIGAWMGEIAEPGSRRFKKTLQKGESLILTHLPEATRNGYTLTCWKTADGKKAYSNATLWDQTYYTAEWTAMTTNWLNQHQAIANAANGDIATAAAMTAANGCRTVGECYALGIDPEDPNDDFKISEFKMEDGKPVITLNHTKDGSGNSFEPRIKTLGKANITDAEWCEVPENGDATMRFFKVTVEIP